MGEYIKRGWGLL